MYSMTSNKQQIATNTVDVKRESNGHNNFNYRPTTTKYFDVNVDKINIVCRKYEKYI